MQKLKAIVLVACIFKFSSCQSIVETKSGFIQSGEARSDDVEAFLGVPYAEPPIGDLRFAKPVPKQPWSGIYDASNLPPPCAQFSYNPPYNFFPNPSNMSEDCLYLNIWKPKATADENLKPIMIYFHYGGFLMGSASLKELDGSHLASRGKVVVVTVNYRLGCFGFLFANIEEANGNMGMYDQIMAIEWIKNNAESFDGDPDNIILMGTSAGSISVSSHIISPLSRHLFKRAIMMSGAILNPIWMDGNRKVFKSSEQVASIVGCKNETVNFKSDPRAVVECMKGRTKEDLVQAQARLLKSNPSPFNPTVGDQFLPEDAITAYREGKFNRDMEVMVAVGKDEGSVFMVIGIPEYFGTYGKLPFKMSRTRAGSLIKFAQTLASFNQSNERLNFYLDQVKNPTSDAYKITVGNAIGDFTITCCAVFAADFLSLRGNPVYFYIFGSPTEATPFAEWVGTMHGEDVQYLFGSPFYGNFTADEVEQSNRLIARMSAFAYTGNPNVPGQLPWLQYSYHNPLYLDIRREEESIRLRPCDRCKVWRKDFRTEIDSNLNGA